MGDIQHPVEQDLPDLLAMWKEFMEYHRELREWAYTLRENATEKIRERFVEYMEEEQKLVLIVRTEEEKAGGFAVGRIEEASEVFEIGPRVRITDFYLRESCRGEGVGRELVERVSNWGREQEAESLFMSIDANNEAGRAFWRALDFEQTRETYLTHL